MSCRRLISTFVLLLVPLLSNAAPADNAHENHGHASPRALPSAWHHSDGHPVHALFPRAPGDGTDYPAVGSPEWTMGWPGPNPDPAILPQEWVDALNKAISAGLIPDLAPSTNTPNTNPVYSDGLDPNGPEVCSSTYKCRHPDDVWDGPDGHVAISFDDGPLAPTAKLLDFLDANNQKATHFMIGMHILGSPGLFQRAFDSDNDMAVHTWNHPYMTTLDNLEVLGQLGWTMQLIRNSTGGRIPRFWRPPYGDCDNRVRAIAKEVFGLVTVIWNQDSEDWSIGTGRTSLDEVEDQLTQWYTGPKSPGLVILEHDLGDETVEAFMSTYPLIAANGWIADSLARIVDGDRVYQNAQSSSSDDVKFGTVGNPGGSSDGDNDQSNDGQGDDQSDDNGDDHGQDQPDGSGSADDSGTRPQPDSLATPSDVSNDDSSASSLWEHPRPLSMALFFAGIIALCA